MGRVQDPTRKRPSSFCLTRVLSVDAGQGARLKTRVLDRVLVTFISLKQCMVLELKAWLRYNWAGHLGLGSGSCTLGVDRLGTLGHPSLSETNLGKRGTAPL